MVVFVRTTNPRPTFHLDMTADEQRLMQRHVEYWSEQAENGTALVFGPVLDPRGVYGIGVYEVDDLAHMQRHIAGDPAGTLFGYEVHPMPRAVVGTARAR